MATFRAVRAALVVIVDVHERDAADLDRLVLAASVASNAMRQLPGRAYFAPTGGTVAELAARIERWCRAAGHEVTIGDW